MDKRFIARVRRRDRIATRIITIGGLVIIGCVIGILVLIGKVALPLFLGADARLISEFATSQKTDILAAGIDDHGEACYLLDKNGSCTFYNTSGGAVLFRQTVTPHSKTIRSVESLKNHFHTLLLDDGSIHLIRVLFVPHYAEDGSRTINPQIENILSLPPVFEKAAVAAAARRTDTGRTTVAALLPSNRFAIIHQVETEDIFGNIEAETIEHTIEANTSGSITVFKLNSLGTALYAGTDDGVILSWDLSDPETVSLTNTVVASSDKKAITALSLVFGDVSLAVADASGQLSTWMPVRTIETDNTKKLRKIHMLTAKDSPIRQIVPSLRSKTIVSLANGGGVQYDHMTSDNNLLRLDGNYHLFGINDRDSRLVGVSDSSLAIWEIDSPHPEINLKTLFARVWYEDYDKPEFVWQSSSGSDDFEPKLNIIPLIFGTIKGTLYAMLFAIPLSIFGAVYTSQFTTPEIKRTIKPAIEIMASVPSVVIGFLIALWLAPIIERQILPVLLVPILLPLLFLFFMALFSPLHGIPKTKNLLKGYECFVLIPLIFLSATTAVFIGPTIENWLFDGSFTNWLFNEAGMRYDQRNCIIIAFGLGIAVIPIIFSITEDAISNIPPSLTAASLALGASRWQTVWRVVLPSASPGIFAAIMIGFGRAVGETMIVLMATGNTPILDWSIFNGMRTLSANIAVEIPEAPFGGTLYRVLFLCATILFAMTFILNTAAEIIRERLRKKYGRY